MTVVVAAPLVGDSGTRAFPHPAEKLLASSSLRHPWLRSSLHTPLITHKQRRAVTSSIDEIELSPLAKVVA